MKSIEEREKDIKNKFPHKVKNASRKSPVIKMVVDINANKRSNPNLLIPLEGIWINTLALKNNLEYEYLIISLEDVNSSEATSLIDEIGEQAKDIYIVSQKVFDSIKETGNSAGIIGICKFPKKTLGDLEKIKNGMVVVLDGLEIPGNIGTIARSCDGADVDGIIICNKKTRLTHPKFIRSSQGACFSVPIVESDYDSTMKWLKENEYRIILTDTDAENGYYEEGYAGKIAIVLGSERYGIGTEWYSEKHSTIKIPMFGNVDSLNVGIAATIILYEATLVRKGMIKRVR